MCAVYTWFQSTEFILRRVAFIRVSMHFRWWWHGCRAPGTVGRQQTVIQFRVYDDKVWMNSKIVCRNHWTHSDYFHAMTNVRVCALPTWWLCSQSWRQVSALYASLPLRLGHAHNATQKCEIHSIYYHHRAHIKLIVYRNSPSIEFR